MGLLVQASYDATVAIARAAALIAPATRGKVLRSFAARRGVRARFQNWAATNRDRRRPLLWIHASSVGEGLQARAVMDIVREKRPDCQLIYTFYSPSAEQFASSLTADYVDYLPFDSTGDARATIGAVVPTALVYSKLDVWPNFTRVASLRGIRLGLISATVAEGSRRSGLVVSRLLRDAYARLDAVGAISEEDASRMLELGARPKTVFVTGDTRYDQVWNRAAVAEAGATTVHGLRSDRPTVVAGSTWPADEQQLIPAFEKLCGTIKNARLIVAPHEPDSDAIAKLRKRVRKAGLTCALLSDADPSAAQVTIVDRLGILGDLYGLADVAFVGGGFHSAGLHSVLEPAAFGVPVLFGPTFKSSRDAVLLIRARGGSTVRNGDELFQSLHSLLSNQELLSGAGNAARALVDNGRGAASRSFELVDSLLSH